jgi:glycosyltransferase involved in cell wall biosynthesis
MAITGAYQIGGGIAAVNRMVIRALDEMGYSIKLLALCETKGLFYESLPESLIETYDCYGNHKIKFSLAVWESVLMHQYDLVIIDLVNIASILAPLTLISHCNYLVWLFGTEVFPPNPDFEGWLGLHFAWKRLAISDFTKNQVLRRYPQLSIQVCNLALELDKYTIKLPSTIQKINDELLLTALDGSEQYLERQVILNVGRMDSNSRYKGQDELLLGFPIVNENFPGSQLILAGDGNDRQRLLDIAKSLPIEYQHRIFMPGFVSQELLDLLYQSCYLFAMPSAGEGFGLVYLEAMARGKPCVGSKLDAAQCVIMDGETGLLVDDPRSPEQVANMVIELLKDPSRARRLGKAGYALLKSKYLYPHFFERFQNIING